MKQTMISLKDSTARICHSLRSEAGVEIQWRQPDGTLRTPREERREPSYPGFFSVAGRVYTRCRALIAEETAEENLARDIYGREVLWMAELFPCFDSYDYMNENRHYRWFYIREDGKLTRVFYADGNKMVEITEDVRYVEKDALARMQELGWVE